MSSCTFPASFCPPLPTASSPCARSPRTSGGRSLSEPQLFGSESFVPGRRQTYFEIANVVDTSLLERHQVSDLSLGVVFWGDVSSFLSKIDMCFSSLSGTLSVSGVSQYLGECLELVMAQYRLVIAIVVIIIVITVAIIINFCFSGTEMLLRSLL